MGYLKSSLKSIMIYSQLLISITNVEGCTRVGSSANPKCDVSTLRDLIKEDDGYQALLSEDGDTWRVGCLPTEGLDDPILRIYYDDGDDEVDDVHDDLNSDGAFIPAPIELTCKKGTFSHGAHARGLRTTLIPADTEFNNGNIGCSFTATNGGEIKRITCDEFEDARDYPVINGCAGVTPLIPVNP